MDVPVQKIISNFCSYSWTFFFHFPQNVFQIFIKKIKIRVPETAIEPSKYVH